MGHQKLLQQMLGVTLIVFIVGCSSPAMTPEALTPTPIPSTATLIPPTPTQVPPTQTPIPLGKTIIVTNLEDSGSGTLRQALQDAQIGDIVTFDPKFFPTDTPMAIKLISDLPELNQGYLTIDASNAGVILDGSSIAGGQNGLTITSDGNTIRGLQIVSFPNAGIGITGGAQHNLIGGDRKIGTGPLGQGNLVDGNGNFGIGLWNEGTSNNTIQGNYIGVNLDASEVWGHPRDGIHSNGANGNLITDNVIGGNDTGVMLCCVTEGKNVISNNIIGTDPTGMNHLGNHIAGVLVDRSNHNMIGPDNLIAYNEGPGVEFWDQTSGNTVMQNMIRDNGEQPISSFTSSQASMTTPEVFDFNLDTGSLSGVACPDCVVEVFSDSGDEGGIYEGQTIANDQGTFTFEKGKAFVGPHLTVTGTDHDGNTSKFSLPTEGTSRNLSLQQGNNIGMSILQNKTSSEVANNRIGGGAEVQDVGAWAWNTGLKWMRVIIDPYGKWQQVDWSKDEYAIDPNDEKVINDLVNNDVKIMLVLDIWHLEKKVNNYKSEEDIATYLSWVQFMVRHFKGRIEYYEILNEPDLSFEKPSGMPVDAYVNLVKRTVPIIREEDPNAKIVVGAVPDTRFDSARDWMWGLLNSEVMPLVDGISWHAMYGAAPSDDPRGVRDPESPQMANYWENYPDLVKKIINVATSNGFKGEFLVEEMLWRTPSWPHESEPYGFTDVSAAKYYARAIIIHLGLDVAPGLSVVQGDDRPRSYAVIRAFSTIMAGAQPADLPVEIESKASNIKYYGFILSNGSKLLAVWSDGVATNETTGIPATITLTNVSAKKAVAIDVLNGFEQELTMEANDGNIVIPNLLVTDYPILVRLEP